MSRKKFGLLSLAMMMGCAAGDPGLAVEAHGKEPPPPPNNAEGCWVTGGGQVEVDNGPDAFDGTFAFNAMSMRNGTFRGHLNHVAFSGLHFRGFTVEYIECFVVEGQEPDPPDADPVIARWWGEGYLGREACDYLVEVEDHGEPALDGPPVDAYHLTVFCDSGIYEVDNVIARGDIQIHPPNPGHPDLTGI